MSAAERKVNALHRFTFEEKPKRWGFRGDPYFWDYLKNLAENMYMISADELEKWI